MNKGKLKGAVIGLLTLCILSVIGFAACNNGETAEKPSELVSIAITGKPESAVALEKGSLQLGIASVPAANVEQFSVKWTSNTQAVATVNADGVVTLVSGGRTTITASVIGKETIKDSFTLQVISEKNEVTSIAITGKPTGEQVAEDVEPFRLGYEYAPKNADDFAVEWYSSTSSVATVDKDGFVTVHGKGVTTIRVSVKGTNVSDEFALIVGSTTTVESLKILNRPKNDELRMGSTRQLSYAFFPEDSAYFTAVWTSGKPDVATVGENGEITALATGKSVITLTAEGMGIKDSFTLTVTEALDPLCEDFETANIAGSSGSGNYKLIKNNYEGVTLTLTDKTDEIPEGGSGTAAKVYTVNNAYPGMQLTPSVLPEAGEIYNFSADVRMIMGAKTLYCNFVFGSNTVKAVSVDLETGASGKLQGTFTAPEEFTEFKLEIFAIGTAQTETAFTVDNVAVKIVPDVAISRPENDMAILEDKTLVLEAEANVKADIVWTSSNEEVASFRATDGTLTLVGAGETLITAKIIVDGEDYIDSFTLKVLSTGILVVNALPKMKPAEVAYADIVITGDIAGDVTVKAEPANVVSVAVEDGRVKITAEGGGTAVVTVEKGGYSDTFEVTVTSAIVEDFNNAAVISDSKIQGTFQDIKASNSAKLSLTDNAGEIPEGGSGKALAVSFEGKDYSYPGVELIPAEKLAVGGTYIFSAKVKSISDVNMIYMKLEGNNNGTHNVNSGRLETGQSKTITLELTIAKEQPNILLFIISKTGANERFTVDDVRIEEKAQAVITGRPDGDTIMLADGAFKLGYTFLGGASAENVGWTSSATDVAEIAPDGTVTPKGAGSTLITLAAGEYSFSFTLTVKVPAVGTVVAAEDFDGEFDLKKEDSNWIGKGSQTDFVGSINSVFQMQHSENPMHIPEGGSGKCLFYHLNNGTWIELPFKGINYEQGKIYEISFLYKLIEHNAKTDDGASDLSGFNVFVRYNDKGGTMQNIVVPVKFTAVGDTVAFRYELDLENLEFSDMYIFLSIAATSDTKISIDNFKLTEL